jgi:hypothetical protein
MKFCVRVRSVFVVLLRVCFSVLYLPVLFVCVCTSMHVCIWFLSCSHYVTASALARLMHQQRHETLPGIPQTDVA